MLTALPATEPGWALRTYLVLIGCAYRSETITYGVLAAAVDRDGPNLLAEPLDCITRWCTRHGLPQLASIVVKMETGMPEPGFSAVAPDAILSERQKVWAYDWFAHVPPSVNELMKR